MPPIIGSTRWLFNLGGRVLGQVGFDDAEYQRGWELFREAMGPDLPPREAAPRNDGGFRELIGRIDRWENRSFDIADATLRHFYPEVHERLFRNIAKTSGPEVIFTVGTFLRRLDELEAEGGRESTEALALLETWLTTPDREYCPHGRPVVVRWSPHDLEKLFKRK